MNFVIEKKIITNIYWVQAYDWIVCRYVCIEFIDFILKEKFDRLYKAILFSATKTIKMKKIYCVICGNYKKFENLNIPYVLEKKLAFFIFCNKHSKEDEKIFKEEESVEILKILGLIKNIKLLWKCGWIIQAKNSD